MLNLIKLEEFYVNNIAKIMSIMCAQFLFINGIKENCYKYIVNTCLDTFFNKYLKLPL